MIISNKEILFKMSNAVRMLSAEALSVAKTGHLGTPLGAADVVTCLFSNFIKFSSQNPTWVNRDRFVLSVGHACILQYSILHLLGYKKFPIESIKNLRQLNSITSGHPEIEQDAGIEVTTGPLGQGVAMSVGLALGERILNAKFPDLINHNTYVLVGDGCLMEGVSYEALSLAGKLGLNKLVVVYDKNNITIDGTLQSSNIEDVAKKMEAFGFNVLEINGHNYSEINEAFKKVTEEYCISSKKPTFIIANTKIGFGVTGKEGTPSAHGGALSENEMSTLKTNLNWTSPPFKIPQDIQENWSNISQKNNSFARTWDEILAKSQNKKAFLNFINKEFSKNIIESLKPLIEETLKNKPNLATRIASGRILEILCGITPNLIGGSADLSSSNNTINKNSIAITEKNYSGNYISYGVREHAMATVMNGLSCYNSGLIPYGGTFLVFSDFMRPAIRLSALMEQQVIYIFTHDNISLGADGPTHQPVEHIPSLSLIPNLEVLRPCDLIETVECYEIALENKKTPTCLILGRNDVPTIRENLNEKENMVKKGGYILKNINNAVINLISHGSETHIAVSVANKLNAEGINTKVISVPSFNRFLQQEDTYKNQIIGNAKNIVISASILVGWKDLLGSNTLLYGMKTFGKSGSGTDLMNYFGFTEEKIYNFIKENI